MGNGIPDRSRELSGRCEIGGWLDWMPVENGAILISARGETRGQRKIACYVSRCGHEGRADTPTGFEMYSDPSNRDSGYVAWQANGKRTWTLHSSAIRANPLTQIGQRLISEEPMAMILNFGSA